MLSNYQGCQNRTGRSDRSNLEPGLHLVWLVLKNGPRENRQKTAKPEKTGDPDGPDGLAACIF
jgi:hypothetical protein